MYADEANRLKSAGEELGGVESSLDPLISRIELLMRRNQECMEMLKVSTHEKEFL